MKVTQHFGLCFLALAILSGTTHASDAPELPDDVVLIEGEIRLETDAKFVREVFRPGIKRVWLNSPGGAVQYAIEMATLIHQRGLDVEVIGDCFSSCANYLFVAGKTKTIGPKGMVAWHGNVHHIRYRLQIGQLSKDAVPTEALNDLQRQIDLEDQFFKKVGVDQFVCWFGKIEPFNVYNSYFLSVADMASFGIRDVRARPDYEATDVSTYDKYGLGSLKLLKVDWGQYKAVPPSLRNK